MASKLRIGYFLEDRGHEAFLKALVDRVAKERGLKDGDWIHDVRAATGGKSIQSYKDFLKDMSFKNMPVPFDLLIIASDGNCKGYTAKKDQLFSYANKLRFPRSDILVFAIPDPHIERWYMDDPHGFHIAIGSGQIPRLPGYKCERRLYKRVMGEAIATSEIRPQFGGYEYGEKIVKAMDLYKAAKADNSLKHFVDDLRYVLRRVIAEK